MLVLHQMKVFSNYCDSGSIYFLIIDITDEIICHRAVLALQSISGATAIVIDRENKLLKIGRESFKVEVSNN